MTTACRPDATRRRLRHAGAPVPPPASASCPTSRPALRPDLDLDLVFDVHLLLASTLDVNIHSLRLLLSSGSSGGGGGGGR